MKKHFIDVQWSGKSYLIGLTVLLLSAISIISDSVYIKDFRKKLLRNLLSEVMCFALFFKSTRPNSLLQFNLKLKPRQLK